MEIEEKSSKEKLVEKSFVGKKERLDQKVSNRISVVRVNDIDHEWAKSFDFSLPRYTLPEYNGWPYFPRDCPFDSLEFLFREITLLLRVHRWLKISPPRRAWIITNECVRSMIDPGFFPHFPINVKAAWTCHISKKFRLQVSRITGTFRFLRIHAPFPRNYPPPLPNL